MTAHDGSPHHTSHVSHPRQTNKQMLMTTSPCVMAASVAPPSGGECWPRLAVEIYFYLLCPPHGPEFPALIGQTLDTPKSDWSRRSQEPLGLRSTTGPCEQQHTLALREIIPNHNHTHHILDPKIKSVWV